MKELTSKSEFDNAIKTGVVLIEFGATWCHFCGELKIILQDVEKQIPSISIYQVDIDKVPGLKEIYYPEPGVPLILIFKDGTLEYVKPGLQFAKDLIPKINNIIGNSSEKYYKKSNEPMHPMMIVGIGLLIFGGISLLTRR